MPLRVESARPHNFNPFQGPSRDRPQTVPQTIVKNCTDRTDREEFKEVTELNPSFSRSVRSVHFLQRSVGRSVDGLWMVSGKPLQAVWVLCLPRIQVGNIVLLSGLVST